MVDAKNERSNNWLSATIMVNQTNHLTTRGKPLSPGVFHAELIPDGTRSVWCQFSQIAICIIGQIPTHGEQYYGVVSTDQTVTTITCPSRLTIMRSPGYEIWRWRTCEI